MTFNFSEPGQVFWSIHSHSPEHSITIPGSTYTFDGDGNMYLYGEADPIENSIIEFIVNANPQITKTFDNVEYAGGFGSNNFAKIEFKTDKMVGNNLDSSDIDEREDTYKLAVPREADGSLYSGRLKGKFMSVKATYSPSGGSKFTMPYVRTTFRQSNI